MRFRAGIRRQVCGRRRERSPSLLGRRKCRWADATQNVFTKCLVRRGANDSFKVLCEYGRIAGDYFPNNVALDLIVPMNATVAHTRNLSPLNLRVSSPELLREPLGCSAAVPSSFHINRLRSAQNMFSTNPVAMFLDLAALDQVHFSAQ